MTLSLGVLFVSTVTQGTPIFTTQASATSNATQASKSLANQTGEGMQSGATNATQASKSLANQTEEAGQGLTNITGKALGNVTEGVKKLFDGK